jgi:hypothetical protein
MAVEACKAGRDVRVEKPACVYVEDAADGKWAWRDGIFIIVSVR